MIVPASCQSLARIGFFYDARIDERKASQGIPALRTISPLARPTSAMPVEQQSCQFNR